MTQTSAQYDNVQVYTGLPLVPTETDGFFKPPVPTAGAGHALASVDEFRAIAEVQASMAIAKRFPRDEYAAYNRIIKACQRKSLAEKAVYSYPRGKKKDEKTGKWVDNIVSGPSIRLAEVLANAWGNIDYGYREIGGGLGYTDVEAYAFDKESNSRSCRTFRVTHKRKTGEKLIDLTEPRDIYELVANQAARRIRSCVLQIIPGDITEEALKVCNKAKEKGEGPLEDRIRKMIVAFQSIGVTAEMLERYMGHALEVTIVDEVNALLSIFTTIKDGEAKREEFFDLTSAPAPQPEQPAQAPQASQEKPKGQRKPAQAPAQAPAEKTAPAAPAAQPEQGREAAAPAAQSLLTHDPKTGEVFGNFPEPTFHCGPKDKEVSDEDCFYCKDRKGCPEWDDNEDGTEVQA